MTQPKMRSWWTDDDPARPHILRPDHPAVVALVERIAPGATATPMGGCLSLNLHLRPDDLVLRVHQRFVTRARILAQQAIRSALDHAGLVVGVPQPIGTVRCLDRHAEVETYVAHERPPATWASYRWMYRTMGTLHRALAPLDIALPRPVVATFGPPSSVARWLAVTEVAVRGDDDGADLARSVRRMLAPLRSQWRTDLPRQLVHGDVRLGNVGLSPVEEPVYLDFGFTARRPRVHDLAYSLSWMLLRPDDSGRAEDFDWTRLPELVADYEDAAHVRLSGAELRALPAYVAAVPLYLASTAGYAVDPAARIKAERPFLAIADWLLQHHADVSAILTH